VIHLGGGGIQKRENQFDNWTCTVQRQARKGMSRDMQQSKQFAGLTTLEAHMISDHRTC
jgi:hypothetical protein